MYDAALVDPLHRKHRKCERDRTDWDCFCPLYAFSERLEDPVLSAGKLIVVARLPNKMRL